MDYDSVLTPFFFISVKFRFGLNIKQEASPSGRAV